MSLWDQLPGSAGSGGALDTVETALRSVPGVAQSDLVDGDGAWHRFAGTANVEKLGIGGAGTPVEFRDPRVTITASRHLTDGQPDEGWRVDLSCPIVAIQLPFLTPARYDVPNAILVPDRAQRGVFLVVGGLTVRLQQLAGQAVAFSLVSAATNGNPVDRVYDLIRMEPGYAIVGPGNAVGFGFRSAVLDLSSAAGPSGIPAGARTMPDLWQGFYLPEIRLFVQPQGLDGLHVTAAARDLYIGVGDSAGVTGIFEVEVVNGRSLTVDPVFVTPSGATIRPDGAGAAQVPAATTLVVDTHGGSGANTITITPSGGAAVTGSRAPISTGAAGTTITIQVDDAGADLHQTLTLHASLAAPAGVGGGSGSTRSIGVVPVDPHDSWRLQVDSLDPAVVTLSPQPPAGATISWTSPTLQFIGPTDATSVTLDLSGLSDAHPIAGDLQVAISGASAQDSDCYFLLDHPKTGEFNPPAGGSPTDRETAWALGPDSSRDTASPSGAGLAASGSYLEAATALAARLPHDTPITVDGYASYEPTTAADYDVALSRRRRDAAIAILRHAGFTAVAPGSTTGHALAQSRTLPASAGPAPAPGSTWSTVPDPGSGQWWLARARVSAFTPVTVGAHLSAELTEWSSDAPVENTPSAPPPPACFRRIGLRVELLRSTFIRAEVWGELDVSSAAGQVKPGLELTQGQHDANPADGIVDFLARMRISEDRQAWSVEAQVTAHQGDRDGLYQRTRGDGIPAPVIDGVGALAVIAPLTAAVSSLSPAVGGAVALVGAGIGASGTIMQTHRITMYGIDVLVSSGIVGADGSVGDPTAGDRVSVLFDVETQFMVDLKIIRTTAPVSARYKAIGMAANWGRAGQPFTPTFVFDPDRGYTIDAPDGSIAAVSPLDQILRVFGFKVSRDNPMFIEVEFGIGLEIGILTIDTATVRATFSGGGGLPDISVSRLRATVDVPGTLHGTGEVSITEDLIGGAFDITVTPVNVRVSASLFIAKGPDGAVGVLFGGLVQLPVPILLGSSGLGIYGFLGGMGVNFERALPDTPLPPLDWAKQHLADNTLFSAPAAWHYAAGEYSFAAGLVLGTVDGGFTLNMKGVLLISVPGPDISLIMLANILSPSLPGITGDTSATILAVIDLDFGRGTMLVALRVDYDIAGLVEFHVPITAFFDTNHPSHWFVEFGNYSDRVSVRVLGVFEADGYLAVYGDGTTLPTDPVLKSEGLSFAVGFHVEAVLMGYKPSGLYLEAAGGFDALLAPDPRYLAGIFEISGELRLWIVSISAWAKLVVVYRDPGAQLYVHGEAHGKVDFFFFSVEGSVELTIGHDPGSDPGPPPPLVSGVSLIARSTQVTVEGSGSSGPVDGSLGKAAENGVGTVPDVPIDVIPVVEFAYAPEGSSAQILGGVLGPWATQPVNPWVQIGSHWWRYDLSAVRILGRDLIPPAAGAEPAAWWVHGTDGARQVALGLLSWVPDAHPAAVPYGEDLVQHVTEIWGDICGGVADAAAQLWSFDGEPSGPSATGWTLTGIPWPDAPGTSRGGPVRTGLRVGESWRIDPAVDRIQNTAPAAVVAGDVVCFDGQRIDPASIPQLWAAGVGALDPTGGAGLALLLDAARAAGLYDAGGRLHAAAVGPSSYRRAAGCRGEVLRSPALDAETLAPIGDASTLEILKRATDAVGFRRDELADAVWFEPVDPGDGFVGAGLLLLVDRRWLEHGLVVAARDSDGVELDRHEVRGTDAIATGARVPDRWLDPDGPWAEPVSRAGRLAGRIGTQDGMLLVWVEFEKLDPSVRRIAVGYHRDIVTKLPARPFYVVAVQSTLASEVHRQSWDVAVRSSSQTAVSTALAAAGTEPLLAPDADYVVEIDWTATSIGVTGDQYSPPAGSPPAASLDAATVGGTSPLHTQRFTFHTGAVPAPPSQTTDLAPWVLATEPDRAEDGVFTEAGITVTFSSQRVLALFGAYGRELFVVVHAASARHPRLADQPDAPTPTVPVTADSGYFGAAQQYGVQTPFREALAGVVTGKPCVDQSHIDPHDEAPLFLPYVFDPLTDYLLDVHSRPSGTDGDGEIVLRVPFTTGRFADLADFARYVADAPVQHRGILTPAALAGLTGDVPGALLDQVFEDAGLGAPELPAFPLVQVLWSTDPTPQPVAVVVESNERLVRTRTGPQKVTAASTDPDPVHHYWARAPYRWLGVARSSGTGAAVDRIVVGPGGTRVVVVLSAGQRGTTLRLDLQVSAVDGTVTAASPALSVLLARAPWEEEL